MRGINHLATVVAAIAHFALGAFWYGMLGGAWLVGIGKSEAQIKAEYGGSPLPYVTAAVAALVVAYTLAWLLPRLGARSAGMGAVHGFVLAVALIGSKSASLRDKLVKFTRNPSSPPATGFPKMYE